MVWVVFGLSIVGGLVSARFEAHRIGTIVRLTPIKHGLLLSGARDGSAHRRRREVLRGPTRVGLVHASFGKGSEASPLLPTDAREDLNRAQIPVARSSDVWVAVVGSERPSLQFAGRCGVTSRFRKCTAAATIAIAGPPDKRDCGW